jgi:pimeloyl-ACP methyl ester carboxylesterase
VNPIPLVLLPGLVCDSAVWATQQTALAPDCSLYAVSDFYGHVSLAGMADAVLRTAPPRFALAGHSMGGRVALQIMTQAPERVERLALFDTGVVPAAPDEPARRQELIDLAREEGMAALAARWLPMIVHKKRLGDADFMAALTAMIWRATPEIYADQVNALLTRPDFRPLLPGIACPVLVACGRQDVWSPLAQHEEIAAAIPQARLAVVEESGHMATVEAPESVTRLLRDWMSI